MRRHAPRPRPAGSPEETSTYRWIDSDDAFTEVIEALLTATRYAVDTEFHRERTYWPQVALVQIAWDDDIVLIDPLALDLEPLGKVFAGPGLAVMHAASQDIEVFESAVGSVPAALFDTQIAAGFLGYGTPSLSALAEGELGLRLPKGDRLTDWLRRPLDERQRAYATADVAHLFALHDLLGDQLDREGRTTWVEAENEALRQWRPVREPERAYQRIKEVRSMRGPALGVFRAVAAWREQRAADIDVPSRHVMSDMAVVSVANRAPRTIEDLKRIRGLDERMRRGALAEQLLAAVERGLDDGPPEGAERRSDQTDRTLRPRVALASAWVAQLARTHRIDGALLATRSDIEELLADGTGRLVEGWRGDLVGGPVRDLVAGNAALAFDGDRLVLEPRHRPG